MNNQNLKGGDLIMHRNCTLLKIKLQFLRGNVLSRPSCLYKIRRSKMLKINCKKRLLKIFILKGE